ncbi:MAG: hypothetical protein FWE23_01360 [Chitinivibrionia bacterium]|nr:hypothetical protein [Chitinivibrionia bacterium]
MSIRDFTCPSCGEPLPIPKNSKGHVKCPSCRKELVIEGLVKNAEVAEKENIAFGIPLSASSAKVHAELLYALSKELYVPLDVLDEMEVVREECHCVPAYCFECEGTGSFTYEEGSERKETVYHKGRSTGEKTHIDWRTIKDEVQFTETVFVSGEKNFGDRIANTYMQLSGDNLSRQLVDFEDLEYPSDVKTYKYDLPQTTAFNDYVKPRAEAHIKSKVENILKSKQHARNLNFGGNRIDKEVKRLFLGLYGIFFTYKGQGYSVWQTGSGDAYCYDKLPLDEQRKKKHEDLKAALKAIPENNTALLVFFLIVCLIGAAISHFGASSILWAGIFLACSGLLALRLPFTFKKGKARDEKRAEAKENLDKFEQEWLNIVKKRKEEMKALHGIYERFSGVEEAFDFDIDKVLTV